MDERRQTVQLINHWNKVKFTNSIPLIESFETLFLSHKLVNSVVIFTRNNIDDKNYYIEFMGKDVINMIRMIEDQKMSPVSKVIEKLPYIANKSVLVVDEGSFQDESFNRHKYRSCLLPFGYSKDTITHFLMYISCS